MLPALPQVGAAKIARSKMGRLGYWGKGGNLTITTSVCLKVPHLLAQRELSSFPERME